MDCLFSDNEIKEMLIYADELKAREITPMIYAATDWDPIYSSSTASLAPIKLSNKQESKGYIGMYYGMPVYTFDGLDSHTCCIMPDTNTYVELPF